MQTQKRAFIPGPFGFSLAIVGEPSALGALRHVPRTIGYFDHLNFLATRNALHLLDLFSLRGIHKPPPEHNLVH